jgi:hypothetical protein
MTIGQMRDKLLEWNPLWNIDKFTDKQIVIIYNKERNRIVQAIFENYA